MAYWYVKSASAGANNGTSWADCFGGIDGIISALGAASAGDIIFCHQGTYNAGAATKYLDPVGGNNATRLTIIATNDDVNAVPTALGTVTLQVTGANTLGIRGDSQTYIGFVFEAGNSTNNCYVNIFDDTGNGELINCKFKLVGSGTSGRVIIGPAGTNSRGHIVTRDCVYEWGGTSQGILRYNGRWESYGDDFCGPSTGATPTQLFKDLNANGVDLIEGGDMSDFTALFPVAPTGMVNMVMKGCTFNANLNSSAVADPLWVPNSALGPIQGEITISDCAAGDNHYVFGHYNQLGYTVAVTSSNPTATATAANGSVPVSWKVVTHATNCTPYRPYRTPWMTAYNDALAQNFTPYVDVLRNSANAAAYKDHEVWAEWSVKETSGFVRPTFRNDRAPFLTFNAGAPSGSDQTTSSLNGTNWLNENGTSPWFGKLGLGSAVQAAEIGDVKVRICVGLPGATVYVDPVVKGLL